MYWILPSSLWNSITLVTLAYTVVQPLVITQLSFREAFHIKTEFIFYWTKLFWPSFQGLTSETNWKLQNNMIKQQNMQLTKIFMVKEKNIQLFSLNNKVIWYLAYFSLTVTKSLSSFQLVTLYPNKYVLA